MDFDDMAREASVPQQKFWAKTFLLSKNSKNGQKIRFCRLLGIPKQFLLCFCWTSKKFLLLLFAFASKSKNRQKRQKIFAGEHCREATKRARRAKSWLRQLSSRQRLFFLSSNQNWAVLVLPVFDWFKIIWKSSERNELSNGDRVYVELEKRIRKTHLAVLKQIFQNTFRKSDLEFFTFSENCSQNFVKKIIRKA